MAGDEIDNEHKEAITMAEFSEDEKRLLKETIAEIGRTLPVHKAALDKLAANK
jgi:hypothetical protein